MSELLAQGAVMALSYAAGRIGHIYGGHLRAPHHWIYGVLALAVAGIWWGSPWRPWLIAFGVGMVVSDLRDMLALRLISPDPPGPKRFWGID